MRSVAARIDRMLPTLGLIEGGVSQAQKASFFCLENEFWRIIALDTGYNSVGLPLLEYIFRPDCALPAELVSWLGESFKRDDDRRGIVLLSHHQYSPMSHDPMTSRSHQEQQHG